MAVIKKKNHQMQKFYLKPLEAITIPSSLHFRAFLQKHHRIPPVFRKNGVITAPLGLRRD